MSRATAKSPSRRKLCSIVKNRAEYLKELVNYIEKAYQTTGDYRWSNKTQTWTIFYRKSSKSLCYIDIQDGGFIVTITIGSTLADKVKGLQLSEKAMKKYKKAKPLHDGRWLQFDINSKTDIADIKKLLTLKRKSVIS